MTLYSFKVVLSRMSYDTSNFLMDLEWTLVMFLRILCFGGVFFFFLGGVVASEKKNSLERSLNLI